MQLAAVVDDPHGVSRFDGVTRRPRPSANPALQAEGTPARYTDYVGMAHGFMSFPGLASAARQALAELCQELACAFDV